MAAVVTFRNGENVRDVARRVAIDGAAQAIDTDPDDDGRRGAERLRRSVADTANEPGNG